MSRQDANAAFALTSFLYGGNAAYIEDLYARYENDPASVDAQWQSFFQSLKDDPASVAKSAQGRVVEEAGLATARQRRTGRGARRQLGRSRKGHRRQDQGQGAEGAASNSPPTDVLQATRDSIHALMLIRAYRIRGHFHAKLDPLELEPEKNEEELDPRSYGFTEADMDRKIYPRQGAGSRVRHHARDRRDPAPHLLPDARRRVHAHLRSAAEGVDPGAHRRQGQGNRLHPRRQARDPEQARRSRRLREIPRRQIHRHQALRSRRRRIADPRARTDHQARRQSRREGYRVRHGASRPAERADPGYGQAAPRAVP